VAVADAFDAMITDRPYRTGLPVDVALQELERGRGSQFDPDIARTFLADPPTRGS
jgi:HD-GYP domain-containing protein (c-di-GMP phosphodiesterase class II)